MASLNPISNYTQTQWHNYIPPSIDQDKLNHLEENVNLNRNTINAIIRNLGIKPNGASVEDRNIYDNPIYETLVAHKNELKRLENDKLNLNKYNKDLGDITQLQGGKTLVEAINNRLRRDIDDSANHTYTFKKLILNNGTSEALKVTGSANITRSLVVAGISSSGKVTVTHADGIETTKLKVNNTATFASTITATGLITANGGIKINGDETITGTLTVENLVVKNSLTSKGSTTVQALTAKERITAEKDILASDNIYTKKVLCSTAEYIHLHWNADPAHKLYVHGGNQALGDGDAFIKTVS